MTQASLLSEIKEEKIIYQLLGFYEYLAKGKELSYKKKGDYHIAECENGFCRIIGISNEVEEAFLKELSELDKTFTWISYPYSERLERQAFTHGIGVQRPQSGLVCNLSHHIRRVAPPEGVKIAPVETDYHFDLWCEVYSSIWKDTPYKSVSAIFRRFHNFRDSRVTLFLASYNNRLAGCSLLDINQSIALCYNDAVLPEFRNRGIGSAMLAHRLYFSWEKGAEYAVALVPKGSEGAYLKSGFHKCCEVFSLEKMGGFSR